MHNVVIFCSEQSTSRLLAPFFRNKFPDSTIQIVMDYRIGIVAPSLPRGIRENQFPVTIYVKWRELTNDLFSDRIGDVSPSGDFVLASDPPNYFNMLAQANNIIFASYSDPRSARNFYAFLHYFAPVEAQLDHDCYLVDDDEDGNRDINGPFSFKEHMGKALEYGLVKAYFDANYAINASYCFGKVLSHHSVIAPTFPLSKFGLQLLFYFKDLGLGLTRPQTSQLMHWWKGTGKYTALFESYPMGIFGSILSRNAIIQNLLNAKLLELQKEDLLIRISELGKSVVGSIHPDCVDPDLPFRLDQWCHQPLSVSKPKIDRYIRTFFGKQKIMMKKLR